ncbi:hypothetical protein PFAG_05323 [Plasmodium falciparum Santa Lucia]|uniref:RIIa domain-containing protein n=12 Tax=Plasmodium falciparum TaxID=5833 RepID=Q8ILK8_PLAF7|nr:conserved Plasmodium protein, unknown function [Plasmodium falciparum 3D7]ETW16330.1 hypothetical protein PFFVO_04868 [Plasmodium falciparum Vietnam Oak-Knoll (FVO)]ETW40038.1 hypothetical protein PFNF135_06064 [Plasmodium falciparum NF135/5.C10]ETW46901.1 hypothetical protein PFMALIP_05064 [Plasmodium falciparum MaliPS096_E11]ETW53886.1 hypothetical protein PFUGPA_03759 [Plasmodium falciparum Palo Alto/Uganda]ETW58891.1 hypothetical protein PFMC_05220 [Plasmodium falciparum CAMP/Malaysia]|eukprot:XP_001348409.1 conserved Plasmodium protein, unknown function [Plasmodium falciparum 3D7]
MRRFNTSQNKNERNLFNDYIKNEDELYDERDDEGINKEPISLKADVNNNFFPIDQIHSTYFLCNNLNNDNTEKEINEHISFEKIQDHEKEEKKKIFLFNLSDNQKKQIENLKINKIIQNEMYLKKNKILKYIIHIFISDILKEKPNDVYDYASNYFTQPQFKMYILEKLKLRINK